MEHFSTLFVYDLTLAVHYVVVLQDSLSDIEVLGFNSLLRPLNGPRQETVFYGFVLVYMEPVEEPLYEISNESLIRSSSRESVENDLTRSPCPAGTPAKLIVYPPGLMPFSADHMESRPDRRHPPPATDIGPATRHVGWRW